MENLEVSRLITALAVAIITFLIRFIYTLLTRNGEKMKIRSSSVELIDKVINERDWENKENRLIVEEAFEQLYSKPLNFSEIKVLMYAETPNSAFRTYLKYRPLLEFADQNTKFRYKKGKRPYWSLLNGRVKLPKAMIKGLAVYMAFEYPASYAMTWLLNDATATLETTNLVIFWFMDGLIWLLAIIFLVNGLRFHDCEKEIKKHLSDIFQFSNQIAS